MKQGRLLPAVNKKKGASQGLILFEMLAYLAFLVWFLSFMVPLGLK